MMTLDFPPTTKLNIGNMKRKKHKSPLFVLRDVMKCGNRRWAKADLSST